MSFNESGYKSKNPIYFGIDFGKTTSQTIVYVVEETSPESFKTLYIEVMPGVNYADQADTIKMMKIEYDPIAIKIDASGPGGQAMHDILSQEIYCGNLIQGFDLTSMFKENIIIRLRMLMQRKKIQIPSKDTIDGAMLKIAEDLEHQLHGIQRTSTKFGLHTRYSGKETAGMDDMVWALALAIYKEFTYEFDPMIVMKSDKVLDRINSFREGSTEGISVW
jgi:phage FluMu gp28-like protein